MPKATSLRNLRPWKPGQSGNPNGRPRAPRFTERDQNAILTSLAGALGEGTQRAAIKTMQALLCARGLRHGPYTFLQYWDVDSGRDRYAREYVPRSELRWIRGAKQDSCDASWPTFDEPGPTNRQRRLAVKWSAATFGSQLNTSHTRPQ